MQRILVVEDAPEVRLIIKDILGGEFIVIEAGDLATAKAFIDKGHIDLILLDVLLPDGNGFNFCATLKQDQKTKEIPVIFITDKKETSDKVLGFTLGADDYVPKPFDPLELKTRVKVRIKDHTEKSSQPDTYRKEDLIFRHDQQRVYLIADGKETPIDLTPREYRLLLHLIKHEGQVFTRDQLMSSVWSDETSVSDRTVDVHISNLRKKTKKSMFKIKAVHGVGYRIAKLSSLVT